MSASLNRIVAILNSNFIRKCVLVIQMGTLPEWPDGKIIFSIFGHLQQRNLPNSIKIYQSMFNILPSTS